MYIGRMMMDVRPRKNLEETEEDEDEPVQGSGESDEDNNNSDDAEQPGNNKTRPKRPRLRVVDRVDIASLPNDVQKRIQDLKDAIAAKRPPPPRFSRRAAPRRKAERWIPEEDDLLLLLRDNGFGYNQIEEDFSWRQRNTLEKRISTLQKRRDEEQKEGAQRKS
jgi:hypothetical protein